MLSGEEIKKAIERGEISIDPFNPICINPNSYNLTLGDELLVYTNDVLDTASENAYKTIKIPKEGYILAPNTLYIARTNERIESGKYIPQLSGRSSIGRIGLTVHVSGGFASFGFKGKWILNITCIRPTMVRPNMEVCQVYFYPVVGKVTEKYNGKYQDIKNFFGSKSFMDFKKE